MISINFTGFFVVPRKSQSLETLYDMKKATRCLIMQFENVLPPKKDKSFISDLSFATHRSIVYYSHLQPKCDFHTLETHLLTCCINSFSRKKKKDGMARTASERQNPSRDRAAHKGRKDERSLSCLFVSCLLHCDAVRHCCAGRTLNTVCVR